MIGFLQGDVLHCGPDSLTVLCGGVGYEVSVNPELAARHAAGSPVRLWVHSAIREQGWDLYGFAHKEERDLFRIVQRVPKIGAKTAQAMLAVFDAPVLIRVVSDADVTALSTVPGIGAKTAQRVIVELKDILAGLAGDLTGGAGARDGTEAVQALLGLGYTVGEAQDRVAAAVTAGVDVGNIEAVVRYALVQETDR